MTEQDINDIIESVSINAILTSILQEHGKLSVSIPTFLDAGKSNKELVIDYDESGQSFVFSLGGNNE